MAIWNKNNKHPPAFIFSYLASFLTTHFPTGLSPTAREHRAKVTASSPRSWAKLRTFEVVGGFPGGLTGSVCVVFSHFFYGKWKKRVWVGLMCFDCSYTWFSWGLGVFDGLFWHWTRGGKGFRCHLEALGFVAGASLRCLIQTKLFMLSHLSFHHALVFLGVAGTELVLRRPFTKKKTGDHRFCSIFLLKQLEFFEPYPPHKSQGTACGARHKSWKDTAGVETSVAASFSPWRRRLLRSRRLGARRAKSPWRRTGKNRFACTPCDKGRCSNENLPKNVVVLKVLYYVHV